MLNNYLIYKNAILISAPVKYGIVHNVILFLFVPVFIFFLLQTIQYFITKDRMNLSRLMQSINLLFFVGVVNTALIVLLTFNYLSYIYLQNLVAICIFYLSSLFTFGLLFITFEFTYKIIVDCKPRWKKAHTWLDNSGILLSAVLSILITRSMLLDSNKLITEFDLIWMSGLTIPAFITSLRVILIILTTNISIKAFNTLIVNNLKSRIGTKGIAGNVMNILQNIFTTVIIIISLFLILKEFYVNIAPLITGLGIVGIGLGWILQQPLQDLAGCVFIILEDAIHIDDIIELPNGIVGKVEQLTLRTIKIRSLKGELHIIPYHKLEIITNHTRDTGYALLDIPVSYSTNIQKAIDAIQDVANNLTFDPDYQDKICGPVEMFGVHALADSAIVIRFRIPTIPHDKWTVARMLNEKIKEKFDQIGISIPFPQRELHIIHKTLPPQTPSDVNRDSVNKIKSCDNN